MLLHLKSSVRGFYISSETSNMLSDELHLANLPSDVIRKIIRIEQESINYLRLIAPEWNSLALEHFTYRKSLPVIQRLQLIIFDKNPVNRKTIEKVWAQLPERYLDYFRIKKRTSVDQNDNDSIEYFERRGKFKPGLALTLSNFVCRLAGRDPEPTENLSIILAKIMSRCSRIENLKINMDIIKYENEYNSIKRAMDGVAVTELRLERLENFNKKTAAMLRDLLRAFPVKRVYISAENTTLEADIFHTLERLYQDTMNLVETGEFRMEATIGIDEFLAIWKEGEERERIRNSHHSRKVQANFIGIKKAGEAPEVKCQCADLE